MGKCSAVTTNACSVVLLLSSVVDIFEVITFLPLCDNLPDSFSPTNFYVFWGEKILLCTVAQRQRSLKTDYNTCLRADGFYISRLRATEVEAGHGRAHAICVGASARRTSTRRAQQTSLALRDSPWLFNYSLQFLYRFRFTRLL